MLFSGKIKSMSKQKTAVDFLYERICLPEYAPPPQWVEDAYTQAKAMEKDRIIKAYKAKLGGGTDPKWEALRQEQAEQYYKETYGDEE